MAFHLHLINPLPDFGPQATTRVRQNVSPQDAPTVRLLLAWHLDAYGVPQARWTRELVGGSSPQEHR